VWKNAIFLEHIFGFKWTTQAPTKPSLLKWFFSRQANAFIVLVAPVCSGRRTLTFSWPSWAHLKSLPSWEALIAVFNYTLSFNVMRLAQVQPHRWHRSTEWSHLPVTTHPNSRKPQHECKMHLHATNSAFMCYGKYMVNTKSRRGKCTWTPPHVVFSTGQLVEYFDGRVAEMR